MELKYYLNKFEVTANLELQKNNFLLGNNIVSFDENIEYPEYSTGIVGIEESRLPGISNHKNTANTIRKYLYQLYHRPEFPKLIDLGNIKTGESLKDTEHALQYVINELLKKKIIPIIIGSKYFSNIIFNVLSQNYSSLNIVAVEPSLSLEINKDEEHSYLEKIIFEKNKALNNFSNIGYQAYLVSHKEIELIKKLNINAYRLGYARANMLETEPVLRDADFVIIDISSVKQADAPGNANSQPNGFYSEEVCQLAKYAGMSNNIKVASICEVNPDFDINDQTIKLAAQIIWHYIDGIASFRNDHPGKSSNKNFTEFVVNISGIENEIKFFKNNSTLRWWIKIPDNYLQNKQNQFIACSWSDYQKAKNNEVPQRILDFINRSY